MKVAIYSRNFDRKGSQSILNLIHLIKNRGYELLAHDSLAELLPDADFFNNYEDLKKKIPIDFLFSFGGDGTLLDSAGIVRDLGIPIVGINIGRIGFLTGVNQNDFATALDLLENKQFQIEKRSLLHLDMDHPHHLSYPFALNDIVLRSSGEAYLCTINVWSDEKLVNSYWGDGLIVSTPTGSTAYSLSCGGPILDPSASVNVITPIATHSLSVRPIVIPSDRNLRITMEGRSDSFLLTLDHHRIDLPNPACIIISKEKFSINTVRFNGIDFFSVIREKLYWGADKRNDL